MEYKIEHKTEENRVEAIADGQVIGLIDYSMTSPEVLTIYHTEVGEENENLGIAAAMTKDLLQYVEDTGIKVRPLCPYARAYVGKHPEYQKFVAK